MSRASPTQEKEGQGLRKPCPLLDPVFSEPPVFEAQNGLFQKNKCVPTLTALKTALKADAVLKISTSQQNAFKNRRFFNGERQTEYLGDAQLVQRTYVKSEACILSGGCFLTVSE